MFVVFFTAYLRLCLSSFLLKPSIKVDNVLCHRVFLSKADKNYWELHFYVLYPSHLHASCPTTPMTIGRNRVSGSTYHPSIKLCPTRPSCFCPFDPEPRPRLRNEQNSLQTCFILSHFKLVFPIYPP